MPLYEYPCEACGQRFEVIQKFSDPPPEACEKCGKGPVHRQQSSPAIQFKGTGWYITDYAQKGKTGGDAGTSTKNSSGTTSGDSSASDSAKSDSAKAGDTSSSTTSAPSTPAKD
jgi:putative FmdB family regulatory protein